MGKEEKLETEQISFRILKKVRSEIDAAAKSEGISTSDWVRNAIDYFLIVRTNACPVCGTYNSLDSRFCKKCGNQLLPFQERLLQSRAAVISLNNSLFNALLLKLVFATDDRLSEKERNDILISFGIFPAKWRDCNILLQSQKDEILHGESNPIINEELEKQDKIILKLNIISQKMIKDAGKYDENHPPIWADLCHEYEDLLKSLDDIT